MSSREKPLADFYQPLLTLLRNCHEPYQVELDQHPEMNRWIAFDLLRRKLFAAYLILRLAHLLILELKFQSPSIEKD